jgi:PAS domain S-box-containing protein
MASRETAVDTPALHDLTVALAGAASPQEVAAEALGRGREIVGAASAHLSIVTRSGWCRSYAGGKLAAADDIHAGEDVPIARDTPLSRALVDAHGQEFGTRDRFRATFGELGAQLEHTGARSAITIPLRRAGGEAIGVLTYAFEHSDSLSRALGSAQNVADQCAVALDRAVLLERERDAARRAQQIHAAATELAAVVHVHELARALRDAGIDALGAAACVAYAVEADGTLRLVDDGTSDCAYPPTSNPSSTSPVGDAANAADALVIDDPAHMSSHYPGTWPADPAAIAHPLRIGSRVVGVLYASFPAPAHLTTEARALAQALAEHAALALDRCMLREHADAQSRLVASERDRLMAITTSLQDGLFTSSPDGLILQTNDRFCEIVGYPREVVVGAEPPYPWWPGVDVDTTRRVVHEIGRRASESPSTHHEYDLVFERPDGARVVGSLSASPLHDADGTTVGLVATVKDVTARVHAERRLRVLQAISEGLAEARTIEDVARAAVRRAGRSLRALGAAFVLRDHRSGELRVLHDEWTGAAEPPFDVTGPATVAPLKEALLTSRVVTSDPFTEDARHALLEPSGAGRAVWIPICDLEERSIACLALVFRRERPTHAEDVTLYVAIGHQCGQALDRALASDAEHRARLEAERSGERTRRLQQATAALTVATEPLDVATALTRHARRLVNADGIALFASDDEARELVLVDNGLVSASDLAAQVVRVPLDAPMSLSDAARTGQAIWVHDADEWMERYPAGAATVASGFSALVVLPLVADGRTLGVLAMAFRGPLTLDDDDRSVLHTLADLAARALQRAARFAEERTAARTLQASLLPRNVEVTDRCKIAVRYEPAGGRAAVGGDWYDALELEPGRLAVMVGDVVGRGLHAAAAMGQLRSALGALAVRGDPPGVVLDMLDRFAERIDGGEAATVAFALIDTACGTMRYACAGHPPPLVVAPGEAPRFLPDGRSWPLGIGHHERHRPDARVRLRPGTAVVLYTDGLVERRRIPLDERLAALAAASAAGPTDDPSVLCDRLIDMLLDDEPRDDIAVLSLVYDPALADRAQWSFPALPPRVRDARQLARRWLDRHGVAEDLSFDIVLACDEACANAVEHGSAGPDDEVELDLHLDGHDRIVATITDRGRWDPSTMAAARGRGHGLGLMEALASSVEVTRAPDGTRVTLVWNVGAAS